MEKRAKLSEIDLVRGFAIIGVLLVHSTSDATIQMLNSDLFSLYNFFNIFFKIGTTTFIFLSSFVLFYNYYPQPLTMKQFKKFYRNRLMYVIVPYLLFTAFYFLLGWWSKGQVWDWPAMLSALKYKLLTGTGHEHLYFVFINIQLYVLFPVLLYLFQRFKWLAASAIVVGVLLQWGFFLWNRETQFIVYDRGSWAPTYLGQYFLGAWLGMYFDRIKSWLIIAKENIRASRVLVWMTMWLVWLAAGVSYVTIYYRARADKTLFHNAVYDLFWDIYTMITPLVLIQVAFLLSKMMKNTWIGGLRHLGVISFGVYLLHPFILLVYRQFPPANGDTWVHHLWYAGGFVSALVISWIVVTVISRSNRWAWLVFGSVPLQLQASQRVRSDTPLPAAPSVPA
ncbi:hypothetical protein SD71_06735 [Cohnella kolymensis]|uniref:Acyltransferase 3 domain-containing protein n=1 Tax=Cohnella kolymensis TaxID=1590652 RepID=A0ABR5A6H8_9BACL|nr:acyltransferase [Cohnella kolymensis]KIL36690.1 hypothetical protein SD71_06735 [Cohnella kolymensis]